MKLTSNKTLRWERDLVTEQLCFITQSTGLFFQHMHYSSYTHEITIGRECHAIMKRGRKGSDTQFEMKNGLPLIQQQTVRRIFRSGDFWKEEEHAGVRKGL